MVDGSLEIANIRWGGTVVETRLGAWKGLYLIIHGMIMYDYY